MKQDSHEYLALLTRTERFGFRLGDFMARRAKSIANVWIATVTAFLVWFCTGRRTKVFGLEHLEDVPKSADVILLANHRSFFDLCIVMGVVFGRTSLPRRVFCPVRADFFYDHPLGVCVNLFMCAMGMFPLILRDRERAAFNRYSVERIVSELSEPGTVIGMNPEGTRNKGPDPYSFPPAQPGIGKIALEAKSARVFPVFVLGPTNSALTEVKRNWFAAKDNPIHVLFGPEIDLSDLRKEGSRPVTQKKASSRCLEAIVALSVQERALHDERTSQ